MSCRATEVVGRVGLALSLLSVLVVGACSDLDIGDPGPTETVVHVLNSTGQTIDAFRVTEDGLDTLGTTVTLPQNYDGVVMDVIDRLAVTTISSLNGSQVVFANVETGETAVATFPGQDAGAVDPSKATLSLSNPTNIETWVAGRGSDDVYRIVPGENAQTWVEDVGAYVERVLPIQDLLLAIDANLDDTADDGDPADFQPLGPSRVVFLERLTRTVLDSLPLSNSLQALNAVDGLLADQELLVLGQGTYALSGDTFEPQGNGTLSVVTLGARQVREILDLQANALSMEPGLDNLAYIVRDHGGGQATDAVSFQPFQEEFVRGPSDPILPTDSAGDRISCWAVSALSDGRLLCVTFSVDEAGRLYLLEPDGTYIDDVRAGFGSTDLTVQRL